MSEQSKIPLPQESRKQGSSLFERAAGSAESRSGFKPAPVPDDLMAMASRAKKASPISNSKPFDSERASDVAPAFAPADAVAPAAPSAHSKTETKQPAKPVSFSGIRHAIDREHLREQGLIIPEGAVTALLEEFRIIKRQLLQSVRTAREAGAGGKGQRVLICSPLPGEGKTFCAVNLALAIAAEKDSEVLLVDADFAKPSVLGVLGLAGGPGLMDALADPTIRVEDCVVGTDIPGLWVLPAGNQTTQDSEFLASDRTEQILERLTQGAPNRMVIFDSPPALAASPAAELAKYVGQSVLVVRADTTGQSAIEDALSLLSTCPDIKLLLNAALFSPSGRRFGTYYGYGG